MKHDPTRASYGVVAEYPDYDHSYDRRIEKAARRSMGGCGFCFSDGYRDVSFTFRSKEAANAAAKRIREMRPKKRGTRVKVYFYKAEA